MTLRPGTRVGPYEIVAPLGAGGMGEVWRASDEKLGRDVALKVLPRSVAGDPEYLARFQREARVLAGLSHTNIATLYGLEEQDADAFLVMELAEGEELGRLLERGPLPVEDVVPIALQIASALEAAHEAGIVHRDLKPSNVMVAPDGSVKVLDFGLAKSWETGEGQKTEALLSLSPTLTGHATAVGVILGTAAYMSPEQAKGRPVDKRADVWSFGVVVWEMLTGRRLFGGETVTEILASVLKEEPDLGALPEDTPPLLRSLVARCLVRDPRDRLRDIGEARILLSGPLDRETRPPAGVEASRARAVALPWALGGLAVGVLATAALFTVGADRPSSDTPSLQASISLAPAARLNLGSILAREAFAVSPSGRQIAFAALDSENSDGVQQLWLRDLGEAEARPVPETTAAEQPSFSPNGEWLAYLQRGEIFMVSAKEGSSPQRVALPTDAFAIFFAWAPEGWILAGGKFRSGNVTSSDEVTLWRLDAETGGTEVLARLDDEETTDVQLDWPAVLPDRRGVVLTRVDLSNLSSSALILLDFETGERRTLAERALRARWTSTGDLVYSAEGRLFLLPFDLDTLSVTGPSRQVHDGLAESPRFGNSWFEISAAGDLVSIPAEELRGDVDTMLRVGLDGSSIPIEARVRYFVDPRVSPDGRKLVFSLPTSGNDIWVHDFDRRTQTRLSSNPGEDETPVWSPDGEWLVWSASRSQGGRTMVRRRPDSSGDVETIWTAGSHFHPSDWSEDDLILVDVLGRETEWDIWVVPVAEPEQARPLLEETHAELHARLSPDGRWLSYTSTETGRHEVYLRPFPALDRKIQISAEGGVQPVWSKDESGTLFYRSDAGMWAVTVGSGAEPQLSKPKLLFPRKYAYGKGFGHFGYDTAPDGTFVMASSDASAYPRLLDLYVGWLGDVGGSGSP